MRITRTQLRRIIQEAVLQEMQGEFSGYGKPPAVFTVLCQAIASTMNKQGGMWIQKKRNAHRSLKNAVNTIVTKDRVVKYDYFPIRDNPAYDEALQEIIDRLVMDEIAVSYTHLTLPTKRIV